MIAFVVGASLGASLWLLLRGLYPPKVALTDRLSQFHESTTISADAPPVLRGVWRRVAVWLLYKTQSELVEDTIADAEVAGLNLETHATDKLNAAMGGLGLSLVVSWFFGFARGPAALSIIGLLTMIGCYFLPDLELRSKAEKRRTEFRQALTGFVSLVAVSIGGGGGVNSAMRDAADIGRGWTFELLRQLLDEAQLLGEPPWLAFDRAGRRLRLTPLIELGGTLGLAGSSGAKVTDSLRARSDSDRAREVSEALSAAEAKSETMNIPIAGMLVGWFGFLGFPALMNLVGG